MSGVKEKIRNFIVENFLFGDDSSDLQDDDSFLEKGIIDSTGVLELVEWLEDSFGISIEDDELIPENLDSIDNLADFLRRKVS